MFFGFSDEKSSLYSFKPDLTFLILDVRTIFGENYFFSYDISIEKRKEFVKNKSNEINKGRVQYTQGIEYRVW